MNTVNTINLSAVLAIVLFQGLMTAAHPISNSGDENHRHVQTKRGSAFAENNWKVPVTAGTAVVGGFIVIIGLGLYWNHRRVKKQRNEEQNKTQPQDVLNPAQK